MNDVKKILIVFLNLFSFLIELSLFLYYLKNLMEFADSGLGNYILLISIFAYSTIFLFCIFIVFLIDKSYAAFLVFEIIYTAIGIIMMIYCRGLNLGTQALSYINIFIFLPASIILLPFAWTSKKNKNVQQPDEPQNISREQAFEKLNDLKLLKERGLITEEEYVEKSKKYVEIILQ